VYFVSEIIVICFDDQMICSEVGSF